MSIEGQENLCIVGPHILKHLEGDNLLSHHFLGAIKTHFESIDMAKIGLQSIMNLYKLHLTTWDKSSNDGPMLSKGKEKLDHKEVLSNFK